MAADDELLMAVECFCERYEQDHGERPSHQHLSKEFRLTGRQAVELRKLVYPSRRVELDDDYRDLVPRGYGSDDE